MKKYENKNYFQIQNNIKNDNPFKGPSQYEMTTKQRKSIIAKTVEKEENEFYDIAIIEQNLLDNKELTEEEMNQLINKFTEIMYNNEEMNMENTEELKGNEIKITRITNIIKMMDSDEKYKVLEELEKRADNDIKKGLFEKLENNFEEFKNEKIMKKKIEEQKKESETHVIKKKSKKLQKKTNK